MRNTQLERERDREDSIEEMEEEAIKRLRLLCLQFILHFISTINKRMSPAHLEHHYILPTMPCGAGECGTEGDRGRNIMQILLFFVCVS